MKDYFIMDTARIVMANYLDDKGGVVISYKNSRGFTSLTFVHNVQWAYEFILCERDIPSFYK